MHRCSLALALLAGCSFPTSEFVLGSSDAAVVDTPVNDVDATQPDVTGDQPAPVDMVVQDNPTPDVPGDAPAPDVVTPDVTADVEDAAPDVPADVTVPNCDPIGSPMCPSGMVCNSFMCVAACEASKTACSGACRDLMTDDNHCGMCANPCGTTGVCRAGACTPRVGNFRVGTLGTSGCATAEHSTLTGGAHGAIAVSPNSVFVSGTGPATGPASATARFNALDLAAPSLVSGRIYESLATNLRDGTVFTFAAGGTPLGSGGGTASRLLEIDPATGALTGRIIALSGAVAMTGSSSAQVGIFSGYDRVVVLTGSRVINITLPAFAAPAMANMGMVSDVGSSAPLAHTACLSWAYYGLAESQGTDVSLVYVQNATTIARTRIGTTTMTTALATFSDLGSICGISASIPRNRWYFQFAGASQFGTGTQTVGFCHAAFER